MTRKPLALAAALALTLLALLGMASTASADPALNPDLSAVSGMPGRITVGPDGAAYFAIQGSSDSKEFGRVTPDGTETEYDSPGALELQGIVAGPDGNIWATGTNTILKIPPADPASSTPFTDNSIGGASDITVGPDGHLWTGSQGLVIEIDPAHPGEGPGGTDQAHAAILGGNNPLGITAGGDGNLWIVDNNQGTPENSAIVKFNTDGVAQGTPALTGGSVAQGQIVAGPPGQLAFTQPVATSPNPQRIGLINYAGQIQFVPMPGGTGVDPTGIVFGNDGAYWTATFANNKLGRLTPDGTFTQPIDFANGAGPRYLAKGPNDTLYVSLEQGKQIARVTGISAPPGGGNNPPPPDKTKPVVSSLKLSSTTFALGSQLASFSRKRRTPVGTTISFRVSEDSTTKFTFAHRAKGFKSGRRCLARRPKGKKRAKPCTRFVNVKPSLSFSTKAGSHRLEFEGRLSKRSKLKPGRYRLSVVSTDAAGNKSKAKTASLRALRK